MGLRESYYRKKWRIDIFIFNHVMSFDAEMNVEHQHEKAP